MARSLGPGLVHQLTAQSMGATFTSPVIDTWQLDVLSWEGLYTGTPTGTFTLEGSDQYDPVSNPAPTFITLPNPTPAFPAPAGAGGSFIVTSPGLGGGGGAARYQRLRYARTGGAGSMDLWVTGTGKA
jgi:hypothetical protein